MEENKKFGRSKQRAKHLRRKEGKWTKTMANKKSRSKVKLDVKKISPRKHAKMVNGGMDALMKKKRNQAPHLFTASLNRSLAALTRKQRGK